MRPNVRKFLSYWQIRLKNVGEKVVRDELENGKTKFLDRKDRMELLRELGLR